MNIRSATPGDLPVLADIHTASWRDAYRGVLPDGYLRDRVGDDLAGHWREVRIGAGDVVLVAERADVVGFIAVWCRPDPFIDNLHVLPDVRSKGVGETLMVAAAERLIGLGHGTAYLWVLESNRRAVQFYERLGGVVGEREVKPVFGHAFPALRMAWSDLSVIADQRKGPAIRGQ